MRRGRLCRCAQLPVHDLQTVVLSCGYAPGSKCRWGVTDERDEERPQGEELPCSRACHCAVHRAASDSPNLIRGGRVLQHVSIGYLAIGDPSTATATEPPPATLPPLVREVAGASATAIILVVVLLARSRSIICVAVCRFRASVAAIGRLWRQRASPRGTARVLHLLVLRTLLS